MARIFLRACLLLLAFALLPQAMAANVALVLSDPGGPYAEFATSFEEYSSKSNWKILAESGRARPRGSTSAIYLDQPPARFAAFVKNLLPGAQRIGLLTSDESRASLPATRQALAGLIVDSEDVLNDASLLGAINSLMPRVNLLLALPDSSIYKRDNIKAILVTSYRHQRPVIAFSKAFVSAGALAAIYSSPSQIARQTNDLLNTMGAGIGQLPPPQAPSFFAISINPNVAQSLNLDVPDEATMRRTLQADGGPR